MNLYFRLIRVLLKAFFTPRHDLMSESRLSFRAWPLDCDINFHLTNSRYLALMDLGRTYHLGHAGIFSTVWKNKWFPVAHACEIVFRRAIKPWQKFDVVSRLVFFDEKSWYIEQRFEVKGQVYAHAFVKAFLVCRGKRVSTETFFQTIGIEIPVLEKPLVIERWCALIDSKWDYFS